jgi:2-oxoisovalerate dehydrogenase E1 component
MYKQMVFIRAFESKVLELSKGDRPEILGSLHLCAGQEAVPLGAVAALRSDDPILCTYRGHGWALAAGIDAKSLLAEICHRAAGINGGRAGSAYLMAPSTRFVGENSIVGAGTTIACGIALANLARDNHRIVVVSIGDGALSQGSVHEAFTLAASKKLPILFVIENNGWSEFSATGELLGELRLAERASAYPMRSWVIRGTDPFLVRDTVAVATDYLRLGQGPALIGCEVPRLWGHYNADIEHYRPMADRRVAATQDPLALLASRLVTHGLMTERETAQVREQQRAVVDALAMEVRKMPHPTPQSAREHIVAPLVSLTRRDNVIETREMTYREAVNAALRAELTDHPETLVYGEDVGKAGGAFGASRNLQKEFGAARVFDTPIAENAILGSAVGAALAGLRPIVEIMFADFLFVALDQLINQAANVRFITGGQCSVPLVVRVQQGATPGSCAQHSQSIEAMLAHIPGIKVALPSSAHDAYALLRAAAADPDPCVVIECRALYSNKGPVDLTAGAEPIGMARLRREGADIALIAWGTMVDAALAAADLLQATGIRAAVLDLRWLSPLDEQALTDVVRTCGGRAVVVHEAVRTGGFGAEIITRIIELCADLRVHVRRLTTPDVRIAAAPALREAVLPSAAEIAATAQAMVAAFRGSGS